ncbi:MAG: C39 family peptidase [Candidatus Aureabacteria bacterium]|nr:C39 family peptidase [Candidatus Auribacterota bacterium]
MNNKGFFIISIILSVLYPFHTTYSKSIDDIKNSFNSKNRNVKEGYEVLKGITFHNFLGKKSFWSRSAEEFMQANPIGKWKTQKLNDGTTMLEVEKVRGFSVWTHTPAKITVQCKGNKILLIKINVWNKGDSRSTNYINVLNSFKKVESRLKNAGFNNIIEKEKVSSFYKRTWNKYNFGVTDLSISSEKYEYFFVKLTPHVKKKKISIYEKKLKQDKNSTKIDFLEKLKKNVKREKNGDIFINCIPMLDQGKKGYCVPATCSRILLYYGIDADMHLTAEIMNTRGKGGTTAKNMEISLRRLCRNNPFSYRKIPTFRIQTIKSYIQKGIPIIWLIPGHVRIIIGYNDKKKEMIYSDSWGSWAAKRSMPYKNAKKLNQGLYLLK